jgi:hypothetical protein
MTDWTGAMKVTGLKEARENVPHKYRRFSQGSFKPKLKDRVLQIAYAIPLGHIAIWVAVALYFLLTQKIGWVTYHWNHLLPWSWWTPVRHDIRNGILEGELAAGAAIIAFANGLRPEPVSRMQRFTGWLMGYTAKPDWADRFMLFLHIPDMHQGRKTSLWQYILALPSVLLMGIPGNLLGFAYFYAIKPGILDLLHRIHVHLYGWGVTAAGGSGTGAVEANLTRASFDAKVIGVLGTFFFARRVFLKVGVDYQDFLAEEHAARYVSLMGKALGRFRDWLARPRWPLPATYRASVWHEVIECERGENVKRSTGHAMRWAMLLLLPAVGWLAWYGQGILAAHGGV